MRHKLLESIVLSVLLSLVSYMPVTAKTPGDAKEIDKVKSAVAKLGSGPGSRVEVKLRDKTKLKGYIGEASENGFVVVDEKTGQATPVQYQLVKNLKGRNHLTGESIGYVLFFGVIIAMGILQAQR